MKLVVSAGLSPSGFIMAMNVPSTHDSMAPRRANAAFASSLAAGVKELSPGRHGNDGLRHLVNGVAHGRLCHAYVLLATNAPLEASGAEKSQRAQHLPFCGKATGSLASNDRVKLVAQATHCSFGQTKMLPELFFRQLFKCVIYLASSSLRDCSSRTGNTKRNGRESKRHFLQLLGLRNWIEPDTKEANCPKRLRFNPIQAVW